MSDDTHWCPTCGWATDEGPGPDNSQSLRSVRTHVSTTQDDLHCWDDVRETVEHQTESDEDGGSVSDSDSEREPEPEAEENQTESDGDGGSVSDSDSEPDSEPEENQTESDAKEESDMSAEEYREQLDRTTSDNETTDSNDDETTETNPATTTTTTTTALVGGSVGSVLLSVPWWCWVGLFAVAVVCLSRRSRSSDSSDDNVPEEGEVEIVAQDREWTP